DTGISAHPASKTIERRISGSRLPNLGSRRSRCLSGILLSALAAMSNFPARTHLSRFLCVSDGDDLCRYIASVSVAIFMSPLLSFLPHTSAATLVQSRAATRSHAYNSKASAYRRGNLRQLLIQLGHQYHEPSIRLNFREKGAPCPRGPGSEFS